MSVEYLVLQADAEDGPFARVRAQKLNQSWETLQAALDELGQYGWDSVHDHLQRHERTQSLWRALLRGVYFQTHGLSAEASAQPKPAPS